MLFNEVMLRPAFASNQPVVRFRNDHLVETTSHIQDASEVHCGMNIDSDNAHGSGACAGSGASSSAGADRSHKRRIDDCQEEESSSKKVTSSLCPCPPIIPVDKKRGRVRYQRRNSVTASILFSQIQMERIHMVECPIGPLSKEQRLRELCMTKILDSSENKIEKKI